MPTGTEKNRNLYSLVSLPPRRSIAERTAPPAGAARRGLRSRASPRHGSRTLEDREGRPLAAGLAGNRRPRQFRLPRFDHEMMLQRVPRAADVFGRRRLSLVPHVMADQRFRDAELDVGFEVGIVARI